jgi:UDP-N-acetyl-2-amino-2-deoxyglucuronate dehydrogenase
MNATRVAIVGPGKVARIHASALARLPGAALVAVVGRDRERAGSFADAFRAEAFTTLDSAVETVRPDVAIVCTPHPRHAVAAMTALEHGMHVLVEKPMTVRPDEARRMVDAARAAGVSLGVVSQRRWYEPVRRVKEAIDDGRIDPILGTVTVLGWRGPEYYAMDPWRGTWHGEGGGVLVNQAVHLLDLLLWFMGTVASVSGYWANLNHPAIEVEDTAVASVRFTSGALASIVASNSQRPGLYARLHVHGRSGASVGVQTDSGSSFVAGVDSVVEPAFNDVWTVPGEEDLLPSWQAADRAAVGSVDVTQHYHELQLRDFIESVREGREPAVTGEDGIAVAELIAAIYRAGSTGETVTLRESAILST